MRNYIKEYMKDILEDIKDSCYELISEIDWSSLLVGLLQFPLMLLLPLRIIFSIIKVVFISITESVPFIRRRYLIYFYNKCDSVEQKKEVINIMKYNKRISDKDRIYVGEKIGIDLTEMDMFRIIRLEK